MRSAVGSGGRPPLRSQGLPAHPAPPSTPDGYADRLLKYVPAEAVAFYLGCDGIIRSVFTDSTNERFWLLVGVSLVGLIGTPFYLRRLERVLKPTQVIVSTIAFAVWIFAIGSWFVAFDWYRPALGALAVLIFTFVSPVINPDK